MHMPDRVLDPAVWGTLDVASLGAVSYAARRVGKRMEVRDAPLMGVLTAFIFAGQMVNFPVLPGVSGHLIGATMAAVLLGPAVASLMLATVLVIQCLLYADGGLYAMGANVFNMGLVAPLVGYGVYRAIARSKDAGSVHAVGAFVAAWASVVAASACASAELVLSGQSAGIVFPAMLSLHALIGVGEGLITVAALELVWQTRRELAPSAGAAGEREEMAA
jgi:cobalt/nickel transport system permease protein